MQSPLNNLIITQNFGDRPYYYGQFGLAGHEGTDFKTKGIGGSFWNNLMGYQPALAVRDGICTAHYGHPYYGTYVELVDNDGNIFYYCHLKNARPPSPESTIPSKSLMYRVRAGDALGVTGNSGNSTNPHLHIMFRPKNFNINNGYFGYEDFMKILIETPTTIKIARIGQNLPAPAELAAQVDHFTSGKLRIAYKDYDVPLVSLGMFTQEDAYNWLTEHPIAETFVQFYYSSPNAVWAASYSFPNLKKQISTLPNNPPAITIAYELVNTLWNYCNDELRAGLGYQPDYRNQDAVFEKNVQSKYDKVLPFLNGGAI